MIELSSGKIRVLVVDDSRVILGSISKLLGKDFDISTAESPEEADALMKPGRFDCLVSDVMMGGSPAGIDLAKRCRVQDDNLAIVLFTMNPDIFYQRQDIVADVRLEKTKVVEAIGPAIEKIVWWKRMPPETRQKILILLHGFWDFYDAIKFEKMASDNSGALRIEGLLTRDKEPCAWVTYVDPPVSEDRVVIGLASTVGCIGMCRFCNSGLRKFKRVLSVQEMIAQFFHAIVHSDHTKGLFEKLMNLTVNFTCEGDSVCSNLDNVCTAISMLSKLNELGLRFIITTIGHQRNLTKFLNEYIHLPVTFYWSLNFRPEFRHILMPAVRRQSIEGVRDVFLKIAEKTGRTVTVAWALARGLNDGPEDIDFLRELFADGPFEVKLTILNAGTLRLPRSLAHKRDAIEATNSVDMDRFAEQLTKSDVRCRKRRLVGIELGSTCGNTTPTYSHRKRNGGP